MKEIKDHERVILERDLPDFGLCQGDLGTVVMVHREAGSVQGDAAGFEVEFMTLDGETVGVTTLLPSDVRPIGKRDIPHVRQLGV